MTRVLLVDDDAVQLKLTAEQATRAGFEPVLATGGSQALDLLRADSSLAAVVLDLVMPDVDGMAVLEAMKREGLTTPVIVQTAHSSLETVITATRHGAFDFFEKPVAPERLMVSLRNAAKLGELEAVLRTERHRQDNTMALKDIVTRSAAMERPLTLAAKAARSPLPALLEGEAGTGKEMLARTIHGMSDRAGRPFLVLRIGALPAGQLDAMLFGTAEQPGRLLEAGTGTLYLDEIGNLPLDLQLRLAQVIETGEVTPTGAPRPQRVAARIIGATSRRLLNLARSGAFREDLYYRLNVLPIYLPPLRDRIEDLPTLASHFVARLSAETGRRISGLSEPALALLAAHSWPGNVHELENVIYRAVALSEGSALLPEDFPQLLALQQGRDDVLRLMQRPASASAPVHIDDATGIAVLPVDSAPVADRFLGEDGDVQKLAEIERELIVFALRLHGYRMSRVARALGIGRSTLYRKLKEYGLDENLQSDAA